MKNIIKAPNKSLQPTANAAAEFKRYVPLQGETQ